MKRALEILFVLSMVAVGCGGETAQPEPLKNAPEGLTMTSLDDTFATGTYRVADTAIRFEAIVANGVESLRITDVNGQEVFRSELHGTPEELASKSPDPAAWGMWHYGVKSDSRPFDEQPEMAQWVSSAEAQLVASMWRDIVNAGYKYDTGPVNALFRYGLHLEEAMAFDNEGVEDRQEGTCDCYGKCGPGCFSVGSNWYCTKHDCCCRTYGSAACYSWCFVYPKCPAPICG